MVLRRASVILFVAAAFGAVGIAAAGENYGAADFAPTDWSSLFSEVAHSIDIIGFALLTLLAVLVGMLLDLLNHLRIGKLIPENLLTDVQEEMANGEYEKALELCDKSESLIGQIFAASLLKTDYSFERMEAAMRGEAAIQGLVWRHWVAQFRLAAVAGFLLGLVGALVNAMRFVSDLSGRPNIGLALASSFELRGILYNIFFSLAVGAIMALVSIGGYMLCSSKLEKVLLEAERLGEELLDPFRPLPMTGEE